MKSEEIFGKIIKKQSKMGELFRLIEYQHLVDPQRAKVMLLSAQQAFKEEIEDLEKELQKEEEKEQAVELKEQLKRLI